MQDMNVRYLTGVGPARSSQLGRLGIVTVGDLLLFPPRTYADRRTLTPVFSALPGSDVTVSGTIVSAGFRKSKKGKGIFTAVLEDATGRMTLSFFNWKYISSRLRPGVEVTASGRVDPFDGGSMVHPEIEFARKDSHFQPRVLPVYPLTAGITQNYLRKLTSRALESFAEGMSQVLPLQYLRERGWEDRSHVIRSLHYPPDPGRGEDARRLLALEELFLHQLILRSVREASAARRGITMIPESTVLERFIGALPFSPTDAQLRSIDLIRRRMAGSSPMRMLIQGDVGCGKTAVAVAAASICSACGYQTAFVAPTEVLAAQHSRSVSRMTAPLGFSSETLTGGTSRTERNRILYELESGGLDILVGTHAVLEDTVNFSRLGLCVIDEQHKFGVQQRESLLSSRDPLPHLLIMSATPIPRTLAMTLYGDLESSVIDQMPPGRGSVRTMVMDRTSRNRVFDHLVQRLDAGERAYIVYPLREASEETDLRDAASSFQILREGPLGRFGIGMLTGAMKPEEKLAVTGRFISGEISVLVSTTVIEVGIDVPEATVMIVANAERFGLSQLHQLRGRIGRGGRDSWCYLMKGHPCGQDAEERLSVLESEDDGFRISAADLRQRGPGEIAGTRQHGIPVYRIASLSTDSDLLGEASRLACDVGMSPLLSKEIQWRFPGFKLGREA